MIYLQDSSISWRHHGSSSRRSVSGVSLIEVMVSVLVLAIGMLGIAAMQSLALRGGQSSLESSQAVMQTTSIIEAMRANRANANSYNGTYTTPPTATSLATRDINTWIAGMRGESNWEGVTLTPAVIGSDAEATIAGCPDTCIITVQWNDTRAGGGTRQVVTRTRI